MMKRLIYSLMTFLAVVMVSQIAVINWRYHTLSYERYRKDNVALVTGYIEKLTWNALNKSVETDVQKTKRTWELKETQILQPLPNHRSDREHTGHDNLVNDTITAAIFSCNLQWISKGEQQRFPRTFECPHTDKRITFIAAIEDESAIKDVDVVIFAAGVNSSTWERAMAVRKAHQVWVYSTAESPGNSPQVRETIGGHKRTPLGFSGYSFNMSFTFHSKSEVVAPFGEYIPFKKEIATKKTTVIAAKPRFQNMVAWVSSHCSSKAWNRTNFVHGLAKLIPVEIYGSCGTNLRLPHNSKIAKTVLQKYKFYIAFENYCCSEYITEKFWQALTEYELVPIVVGASKTDYERVAPPNFSFR
ncbi:putative glycoprotein 3-alpha-L-fucosyltransferase A-like [Apostichopus japonicus]|uniref:Fucosyltransferase n=1 Tax=Stichopus japonicus TaxID=307972 RepID=A0A2G8LHG6_STIJA|nr:putative glycoprotein 3-alpha-L-fucosyltransferase A-like [Apostichopus japonicus]